MAKSLALITGASGGIGADIARELAKDGHDLILVARTQAAMQALADELARTYGTASHIIVADLAKPGSAKQVFADVATKGLNVDCLVNNAGFGDTNPVHLADPDKLSQMVQLNIGTLTDMTRQFLPAMVDRRRGRILNVASIAGFQPGPNWAVYCASKAYVLSFSEAVAEEVAGFGVTVTALCPGATETGFANAAAANDTAIFTNNPFVMKSNEVARLGVEAMRAGRKVIITGVANKVQAAAGRYLPHALSMKIASRLLGGH